MSGRIASSMSELTVRVHISALPEQWMQAHRPSPPDVTKNTSREAQPMAMSA